MPLATLPALLAPNGSYELHLGDAREWLRTRAANSIHAIVTDPPYGLKEYSEPEKLKLRKGRGGLWRIPPSFDGCMRRPLPRFTVLDKTDHETLRLFFSDFAREAIRVLVPGAHLMIATNALLSHLVYVPLIDAGFEKRGEIIRLVRTLRGGDRPKNAHVEFSGVTVMPRSGWEPWGLFRKPCEGRVQDNLRRWGTGGLRRVSQCEPFGDVIRSTPAGRRERTIAPHPSLKPQGFMRQIVQAALPLGRGIVLGSVYGSGLYNRRRGGDRIREHRCRDGPGLFRNRAASNPYPCGTRKRTCILRESLGRRSRCRCRQDLTRFISVARSTTLKSAQLSGQIFISNRPIFSVQLLGWLGSRH